MWESRRFAEGTRVQGMRNRCQRIGIISDNTVIGSAVQATLQYRRYCVEIKINSLQIERNVSWVITSRGLHRYVTPLSEGNTNTSSMSTSSLTDPEKSGTGQLVATHELSVSKFKAPQQFLAGRAKYVAVENDPQPSLEARGTCRRQQQELPKANPVKCLPNKPGVTYIPTENRQWHTIPVVDKVSCESLPVSKNDFVAEARSHVPRTRLSNSLANNCGSCQKDSTKPLDGHSRTGRDPQNTDRTTSGSSIASTIQAIRSICEPQDTPVGHNWTQSCKITSKFEMDQIAVSYWTFLWLRVYRGWKEVCRGW